jgi:hypothetical protein
MIPNSERQRHDPVPDNDLVAWAQAELRKSCYPEIRGVVCEAGENALRLSGSVPKYFYKQVAQSLLIDRLPGRPRIENHLTVNSQSNFSMQL